MGLHIQLRTERLLPFGPFRSLAQIAFWMAMWVGATACLSLFIHDRPLLIVQAIGMAVGALWGGWVSLLPYELKIEPVDVRECLIKVGLYLARSRMRPAQDGDPACPAVGDWVPDRRIVWKGMDVEVSVQDGAVLVRGPRGMIKPLWRNFRGVWRNLLAIA